MATKATKAPMPEAQLTPTAPSVTSTRRVDISRDLPDLSTAKPKPVNLALDYWTPQAEGECKTLIFMRVQQGDEIPDYNDPDKLVSKDCAYFIEQTDNGFQILRNASARLVSLARNFLEGEIYQITFVGKRANKTNSYQSSYWAVQPVELAA